MRKLKRLLKRIRRELYYVVNLERYRESLGISDQILKSIEEKTGKGKKYLSGEALNGEGVLINGCVMVAGVNLDKQILLSR